jgi:hypothetical protein
MIDKKEIIEDFCNHQSQQFEWDWSEMDDFLEEYDDDADEVFELISGTSFIMITKEEYDKLTGEK